MNPADQKAFYSEYCRNLHRGCYHATAGCPGLQGIQTSVCEGTIRGAELLGLERCRACGSLFALTAATPSGHTSPTTEALALQVVSQSGGLWNQYRRSEVISTFRRLRAANLEALPRPFARLQLSSANTRRTDLAMAYQYILCLCTDLRCWPIRLCPCSRCGQPTGSWCDNCDSCDHVLRTEREVRGLHCGRCFSEGRTPVAERPEGIRSHFDSTVAFDFGQSRSRWPVESTRDGIFPHSVVLEQNGEQLLFEPESDHSESGSESDEVH